MIKCTPKNVVKVLGKMVIMAKEDKNYAKWFADFIDDGLNDLLQCDAFGTEGQCDPRGDQRND